MKGIHKVHPAILLILYFIYFPVFYFTDDLHDDLLIKVIFFIPYLIQALWTFEVNRFIDRETQSRDLWSYGIHVMIFLIPILFLLNFIPQGFPLNIDPDYFILYLLDLFIALNLMFRLRKVFYARSLWFIFIEILVFPIGLFTLTQEIKKYYHESKIT